MIDPVRRSVNRRNFIDAVAALKDINPFPFFGTLLGLIRDGDVIKGDDDVDLYVNIEFRDRAIECLIEVGFEIDVNISPNQTPYFAQAVRIFGEIRTFVDIYFYEDLYALPYITERWNFAGTPACFEAHMNIPKYLLFPLKKKNTFGIDVWFPAHPKKILNFLYGDMWRRKLSKINGEYITAMIDNEPLTLIPGSKMSAIHRLLLEEKNLNTRESDNNLHLQQEIARISSDLTYAETKIAEFEVGLANIWRALGFEGERSANFDFAALAAAILSKSSIRFEESEPSVGENPIVHSDAVMSQASERAAGDKHFEQAATADYGVIEESE